MRLRDTDAVPHYFLTSARLGFRVWTRDDLDLARALWGDPRATALIGGPLSDDAIRARLEREMQSPVQYWPVFQLSDGAHIGCAGLRPYEPDVLELGVHLRPEFWGRGFAEEASRAVTDYAFRELGVHALFAGHHPENAASRKLLQKLGFEFIGEQFYAPTGLMHPSYRLRCPRS